MICLGIQGHSAGAAIVVINPVVAIDMEPVVVEVEASSPSLVASLPSMHCHFIFSLLTKCCGCILWQNFAVINWRVALVLSKTKRKKYDYL